MKTRVSRCWWFLFLFVLFTADAHGQEPPAPEAEFKLRTGIAPYRSIRNLLKKPRRIESLITSWMYEGDKVIRSETDYHAIYPLPLEVFLEELLDYENTKNTYPRVEASSVVVASENPFDRHVLRVELNLQVFKWGDRYHYITNNWMEPYEAGFVQKYNLEESPDGKIYQMLGNWYIEPIEYQGKEHTYVRKYAILGIRKGTGLMEFVMKTFGDITMAGMFKDLYRAVERRQKALTP